MLTEQVGSLWNHDTPGSVIVVPTNVGWTRYRNAIMGAGVARGAALRYPGIVRAYGVFCKETAYEPTPVAFYRGSNDSVLCLAPTKALDPQNPQLSWKHKSTIDLVEQTLYQIKWACSTGEARWITNDRPSRPLISRKVYLPLLGAGNGGLDKDLIRASLERILGKIRTSYVLLKMPQEEVSDGRHSSGVRPVSPAS